jgi:hypothetical protein
MDVEATPPPNVTKLPHKTIAVRFPFRCRAYPQIEAVAGRSPATESSPKPLSIRFETGGAPRVLR